MDQKRSAGIASLGSASGSSWRCFALVLPTPGSLFFSPPRFLNLAYAPSSIFCASYYRFRFFVLVFFFLFFFFERDAAARRLGETNFPRGAPPRRPHPPCLGEKRSFASELSFILYLVLSFICFLGVFFCACFFSLICSCLRFVVS